MTLFGSLVLPAETALPAAVAPHSSPAIPPRTSPSIATIKNVGSSPTHEALRVTSRANTVRAVTCTLTPMSLKPEDFSLLKRRRLMPAQAVL